MIVVNITACSRGSSDSPDEPVVDPAKITAAELKDTGVGIIIKDPANATSGKVGMIYFINEANETKAIVDGINSKRIITVADTNYKEGTGFTVEFPNTNNLNTIKVVFKKTTVDGQQKIQLANLLSGTRDITAW